MARRPVLAALADRLGILAQYLDVHGRQQPTTDATRVHLAKVMGFDATSEAAAGRALQQLEGEAETEVIEPVRVVRTTSPEAARLPVRPLLGSPSRYEIELVDEHGARQHAEGHLPRRRGRRIWLDLPRRPDCGYHTLRLSLVAGGVRRSAEQRLIVCPESCMTVAEITGGRPLYGFWTNLYTVRSERNWGIGDLTDLRELLAWAGGHGAGFVGINPLHALRIRSGEISPYSPVSRLYRSMVYLDVAALPELSESDEARDLLNSPDLRTELAGLRRADQLDYARVMAVKEQILVVLHQTFARNHQGRDTPRGRAYERYRVRHGRTLTDFATFRVLERHFAGQPGRTADWHTWPVEYRDPTSDAVRAFRHEHARDIDFHFYIQFGLDEQLAGAAARGRAAAMPIGVYGDLAVGTGASGSDPWMFPHLFADGAHIGAPPDDQYPEGQDWGLPPIDPRQLKADRYDYWIALVRNALEHCGGLRIDHVMGLFRQYWVPVGDPAASGGYVRYPAHDLLGILALESRRQGALVIGEDLGTVPRGLPALLARWGILSSDLLYFERTGRSFNPSSAYSNRALVTANTHDHVPLAGFWQGRDLTLRHRTGLIPSDEELARARAERERDRRALVRRLAAEGIVGADATLDSPVDLCAAVYAFVSRTPAPLIGIALDDLGGEVDPVNIPSVTKERYPSWSRRMGVSREQLTRDPSVRRVLDAVANRRTTRAGA